MEHQPLPVEFKPAVEFGTETELLRYPCSCGWRGCWFGTEESAALSFQRHAERKAA